MATLTSDYTPFGQNASTGIPLRVFFTPISVSSNHGQVVAGVAGSSIKVLNYLIMSPSATTLKFEDYDGVSTYVDVSGPLPCGANGGCAMNAGPAGCFKTVAGHGLTLNNPGAVAIGGHIAYVLE